jgi:hypothetical protein
MDNLDIILLLKLLFAHFLSDFVFQPKIIVKKKEKKGLRSIYFYIHVLITFITVYLFLWNWSMWHIAAIITCIHFVLDTIKYKIKTKSVWIFLIDQFLHIAAIIIVWLAFSGQFSNFFTLLLNAIGNINLLWILLAFLFITIPASTLIGHLTKKWSNEIDGKNNRQGLKHAGKWIGIIERVLILTFIIIDQISFIGFLLAAKSVFRFGNLANASEHKKTEYIIIGTFISFSIAIFTGLLIRHILK